jgi:hypothetical protein
MTSVLAVLDEQQLDLPARVPTLVERASTAYAPADRQRPVETRRTPAPAGQPGRSRR